MVGYIIAYSYLAILVGVAIAGLVYYKSIHSGYVRRMIHLVWFSVLIEITSKFVLAPRGVNSLWLFNAAIPVFFLLINLIYYDFFREQARIQKMIIGTYILFLLFYSVNVIFMQDFYKHIYNYSIAAISIFVVVWTFLYFRHKFQTATTEGLGDDPMFWISSGLLVFYGAEAFAMGSINYLNGVDRYIASAVLSIVQVINIPMYIMFLIAMICRVRQTRYSSQ